MTIIDVARILFALVAVLGMIGAMAYIARRFNMSSLLAKGQKRSRLQIVDSLNLDPKRKLIIIKCDEREHLMVFSPGGETLIDNNIPQPLSDISLTDEATISGVNSGDKMDLQNTQIKAHAQDTQIPKNPFAKLLEKHFTPEAINVQKRQEQFSEKTDYPQSKSSAA